MISHDQVRILLAREPMTAIFMDDVGSIVKLVPVPEKLTTELVLELGHSHPGLSLIFRPKGEYSGDDFEKWRRDTVEGVEVFRSGKLPLGWRHL